MTNTLLKKSPTALSVSVPTLYRDPLVRPGTKFLYDFTDPRCHPGGVITTGSAIGKVFTGLSPAGVAATVVGGSFTTNADGSFGMGGTGGSINGLSIGSAGQFDMHTAPYQYVWTFWCKIPSSGYTTTANKAVLKLGGSSILPCDIYLDFGSTGLRPRGGVGDGTAITAVAQQQTDLTPGSPMQLAVVFVPGTHLTLYINNVVVSDATTGIPTTLADCSALVLQILDQVKLTVYRVLLTDIDASIAQETAWGLAASDILTSAQYIARDYAFCTGALSGAPKTAFT